MPVLGFGRDKEKFCQLFQKLRGVEQRSTALRGVRGRYVPVGRCPAADRAGRRDP